MGDVIRPGWPYSKFRISLENSDMTNLNTYTSDLRDIATACILHREGGAVSHSAFSAALNTYQQCHPQIPRDDAVLVISQLIDDLPQSVTVQH